MSHLCQRLHRRLQVCQGFPFRMLLPYQQLPGHHILNPPKPLGLTADCCHPRTTAPHCPERECPQHSPHQQRPRHRQAQPWTSTMEDSVPAQSRAPSMERQVSPHVRDAQKPPQHQQHPLPRTRGPLAQCCTHIDLPAVSAVPSARGSSGDTPVALFCAWQHHGYTQAQVSGAGPAPGVAQTPGISTCFIMTCGSTCTHGMKLQEAMGAHSHSGKAKGRTDHAELPADFRGFSFTALAGEPWVHTAPFTDTSRYVQV